MSQESDVQDCLIEAIYQKINAQLSPGDFNTETPESLLYADGAAWLSTLATAADCLRDKGYELDNPATDKANGLRTKILVQSQAYLDGLIA